jgi:hypothetical protein
MCQYPTRARGQVPPVFTPRLSSPAATPLLVLCLLMFLLESRGTIARGDAIQDLTIVPAV